MPRRHPARPARAAMIFVSALLAASVARADHTTQIGRRVAAIIAPVAESGFVGVFVASLTRGDTLCAINADRAFLPASNEKLQTAATALAVLGADHRFSTSVLASVSPDKDGTLAGDLVLRGGGDPVLSIEDLAQLARQVREAGVAHVTGRLLADESLFDGHGPGAGWEIGDEPFDYAAQISALSCNRNVISVDVVPASAPGEPPLAQMSPLPGYLDIDNRATTGPAGSDETLAVSRARGRNTLVLRGSTPAGGPGLTGARVTLEDPARFTALLFRSALREAGITIAGAIEPGQAPPGARVLAELRSSTLADILPRLNKPSDNLIAEILLRDVGAARSAPGTAAAGLEAVRSFLQTAGADPSRFAPVDGSGLSRQDLTTPRTVAQLLVYVRRQLYSAAFRASLPIAGVDGTLRRRMIGTPAARHVFAKTGSMAHVSALSGYVAAANGEELVFSLLTNNYPGPAAEVKQMEDRVAIALAEFRR